MRISYLTIAVNILLLLYACEKTGKVIQLAVTSDVHGMIFPVDLGNRNSTDHSMAHVYQYAEHGYPAGSTGSTCDEFHGV